MKKHAEEKAEKAVDVANKRYFKQIAENKENMAKAAKIVKETPDSTEIAYKSKELQQSNAKLKASTVAGKEGVRKTTLLRHKELEEKAVLHAMISDRKQQQELERSAKALVAKEVAAKAQKSTRRAAGSGNKVPKRKLQNKAPKVAKVKPTNRTTAVKAKSNHGDSELAREQAQSQRLQRSIEKEGKVQKAQNAQNTNIFNNTWDWAKNLTHKMARKQRVRNAAAKHKNKNADKDMPGEIERISKSVARYEAKYAMSADKAYSKKVDQGQQKAFAKFASERAHKEAHM